MSISYVSVPLEQLPHGEGLELPTHATDKSAGMDLRAAVPAEDSVVLPPGERTLVPTGFRMALPKGYDLESVAAGPRSPPAPHRHGPLLTRSRSRRPPRSSRGSSNSARSTR